MQPTGRPCRGCPAACGAAPPKEHAARGTPRVQGGRGECRPPPIYDRQALEREPAERGRQRRGYPAPYPAAGRRPRSGGGISGTAGPHGRARGGATRRMTGGAGGVRSRSVRPPVAAAGCAAGVAFASSRLSLSNLFGGGSAGCIAGTALASRRAMRSGGRAPVTALTRGWGGRLNGASLAGPPTRSDGPSAEARPEAAGARRAPVGMPWNELQAKPLAPGRARSLPPRPRPREFKYTPDYSHP